MDRWALHDAFVRTAETGSLSRAAKALGLTQPAMSKRLEALERAVGVRLLERSTRGVRLTDAGVEYLEVLQRVRGELDAAETSLALSRRGLSGTLRLSFPVALGETWLTAIALRFQQQHPGMSLDISQTDEPVDLAKTGIDLGVRVGSTLAPHLAAKPLGTYGFCLVASPRYLQQHGTPTTFEQLTRHPFYSYFGDVETFRLPDGKTRTFEPQNKVRLRNSRAILTAMLGDAGIARVSVWAAHEYLEAGKLVRVLDGLEAPRSPVHAVYLPSRYVPERIKAFAAYLAQELPKVPGWLPPA
ncbi:MAG: LysR family transcriptional regulator [Myxococcaceae bacterium]